MYEFLDGVHRSVIEYLSQLKHRRVSPASDAIAGMEELDIALPDKGLEPASVIRLLHQYGSPATVATAGPRYFGFVTGGSLPAALGANYLASAWDQLAGLYTASPISAALEATAERWLLNLLDMDSESAVGFVTGATTGNFTGLATARNVLLNRRGWNVEDKGLFGAPEITVVVGEEYHASLRKALSMVGFGRERVTKVPVDDQGCLRADAMPDVDDMTIVCLQAGNVNTGGFDPLSDIIPIAREARAWVHVDAAFGLWARASPQLRHVTDGIEQADSVATDAHKWLNVPYDSGLIFVRDRDAIVRTMSASASYLIESDRRENFHYSPEMSRRARGVEVWAALLSLGKDGVRELVERNCRQARSFAEQLEKAGFEILNDVVLNQVLVSFGDSSRTTRVIREVQNDGTLWVGGTVWQGTTAMRISVSSWATTDDDITMSVEAIVRIARSVSSQTITG